jgi:hypothetical protein
MQRGHFLAGSTVVFLVGVGATAGLFNACSPNASAGDSGADAVVCDPKSNDPTGCPCDPNSQHQVDCYSGPPGTSGKGICQPGVRKCTPQGTWSACTGEITPQPELCNLADDDCDGLVDDLFNDAAVLANCNSPACSPSFEDAAITCWGPDPGICGAGTKTCAPGPKGGTPTGCNEFIHTPAAEICNGIDDDCNGSVDDGLDQEGPCDLDDGSVWPADANPFDGAVKQVLGDCLHGNLTCVSTNCDDHQCKDAGDQCFPSAPGTEKCDGKDNDCNGVIDDHACAANVSYGYTLCCHSGAYYTCGNSNYPSYGYQCVDAGP